MIAMYPAYGVPPPFRARFRSLSIRAIPWAERPAHPGGNDRRHRRRPMDGLLALSNDLAAAVEHAGRAVVGVNGRRRLASTVAGRDPAIDLAVLRVDAGELPVAEIATEPARVDTSYWRSAAARARA